MLAATAAFLASVALAAPAAGALYLGTPQHNEYHGTRYSDRVVLFGGNDMALGVDGADSMYGGEGSDAMRGGRGADRLTGGPGADQLEGGPGPDMIYGGAGSDSVNGGSGRDMIWLGADNDEVILMPDGVHDEVWCGDGIDTATLINHADPHDVLHSCEETLLVVIQP